MEKMKQFITTKTTLKLTWLAVGIPFATVVVYIWFDKMAPADFHQHLSEYTKWVIMTLVLGKAGHEVGTAVANRGQ